MSNASDPVDQGAIERQQKLLAAHRERLALLLTQQAQLGAYAPPHVIIDIKATQEALRPIKAWLRSQGVPIMDEPNDEVQITVQATPPGAPIQTINNQTPNQGAQGIFHGPVSFGRTRQDDEPHER